MEYLRDYTDSLMNGLWVLLLVWVSSFNGYDTLDMVLVMFALALQAVVVYCDIEQARSAREIRAIFAEFMDREEVDA